MNKVDINNLTTLDPGVSIDDINKEFYGKYNYPWPPLVLNRFKTNDFPMKMLHYDLGIWDRSIIPIKNRIWVAGCGANQALITALKFPESEVIGTDVSSTSLKRSAEMALQLNVKNLELRQQSINDVKYRNEFDYVICTGVIHHNRNPQETLGRLDEALKDSGIMELMVYNYYHVILMSTFQKVIKELNSLNSKVDFDKNLEVAKKVISGNKLKNVMGSFIDGISYIKDDGHLADYTIQPVLHSYTIKSFQDLVESCNLKIVLPCINQFDVVEKRMTWNLEFSDESLNEMYYNLSDLKRWYIANMMLAEESPMIWFYLAKKSNTKLNQTEEEVCKSFLEQKFMPAKEFIVEYIFNDGKYELKSENVLFTSTTGIVPKDVKEIYQAINPNLKLREVLNKLGVEQTFPTINKIRNYLATSINPFIEVAEEEDVTELFRHKVTSNRSRTDSFNF